MNSILHDGASPGVEHTPLHSASMSSAVGPGRAEFGTTANSPIRIDISSPDDDEYVAEGASAAGPSTSYALPVSRTRKLHFQVEYRDKTVPIIVSDSETVGKIKELLFDELGIPTDKQELNGIVKRTVDDQMLLRDLHLPKENKLYLLTPGISNPTISRSQSDTQERSEDLAEAEFTLVIKYFELSTYRMFTLKFKGNKTILSVKQAVYTLTDVSVRHQVWTGWPDGVREDDTIARSGINYPTHELEVRKVVPDPDTANSKVVEEAMDVDASGDEEDNPADPYSLEDDIFCPEPDIQQSRRQEPLMPENVTDDVSALEHFTREFKERYGEYHPVFYIGSLDDAIKDALQVKAVERKMLAIYIHHDSSIFSHVFCSQRLCSESIVNFLSSNFLTWAWDVTFETNRARLINMATRHFGSVAASQIRNYGSDQLPALLLITRSRATNEVVDVIPGHVLLDELMTRLLHAVEVFREQQQLDIEDEQQRDAREQIKQEQDAAYQESLAADRAKAEVQKAEEKRQQAAMEKEMERQWEEQRKKQEEQAVKEAIMASLARILPDEPPEGCTKPVTKLRIRTPSGEVLTRKFLASETVGTLMDYLTTKGFITAEYKVLSTFPRRDITQLDPSQSLKDANLYPQETLTLEEKS